MGLGAVSDTWYRSPAVLPPYEDWSGSLWTFDGILLNPQRTPIKLPPECSPEEFQEIMRAEYDRRVRNDDIMPRRFYYNHGSIL